MSLGGVAVLREPLQGSNRISEAKKVSWILTSPESQVGEPFRTLRNWVLESPNEIEEEIRTTVLERIDLFYDGKSEELDFSGLNLSSLPDIWRDGPLIEELQSIDLTGNPNLKDLPPSIVYIESRKILGLNSSQVVVYRTALLDQLKKRLRKLNFCFSDEEFKKQAIDLLEQIPSHWDLEDLVNSIFLEIYPSKISCFLDLILLKFPLFRLSPYNQIRKKIADDENHLLNNKDVLGFFEENKGFITQEEISSCYDLAYTMNHPFIYPLADAPVSSSDYNVNFLWVNLDPQDREKDCAENIFGNGLDLSENAESIENPNSKSFTSRITKWARANPDTEVNLWYDSALVTEKAQKKTFKMMQDISQSQRVNLKLRDIRCLDITHLEIKNSLHPATPVYYRVDLLKVLISDYMMRGSKDSPKYCVVSDIDVEPMSSDQLFDERTLEFLSSSGYVFSRRGIIPGFENNFFIFNKEKENLPNTHYDSMVKGIIEQIEQIKIDEKTIRERGRNITFCREYVLHSQSVFSLYRDLFSKMEKVTDGDPKNPRKVIKSPDSQFESADFSIEDHQKELFYWASDNNVPYTHFGRNVESYYRRSADHTPIRSTRISLKKTMKYIIFFRFQEDYESIRI